MLIHPEGGLPRYRASHDRPPGRLKPGVVRLGLSGPSLDDLESALAEAWSCAVRALGPAAPEDTPDDDGLVPTGGG
ncbi:hypothetical protein AQI88_08795 [Streptomyces cellostaticus]|uniref:Uncharacterized protein n=1 Tax=Streptomyces cellostaticus TaxID=67285 RepID=A0A101NQ57_9ACTN|nr:hypothetical protein AQI88_08795 [Streptomyces cellostaticus]GHI03838.1 hypothetical protein Scel_21590 [Streptomyces cellostaticus]